MCECEYVITLYQNLPALQTFHLQYMGIIVWQLVYIKPIYFHPSLWIIPELAPRSPLCWRETLSSPLPNISNEVILSFRDEIWEPVCLCGKLINLSFCLLACLPLFSCLKSIFCNNCSRTMKTAVDCLAPNTTKMKFIQYHSHQSYTLSDGRESGEKQRSMYKKMQPCAITETPQWLYPACTTVSDGWSLSLPKT